MAHYYTNEENLKSDIKTFQFNYLNKTITFKTDSGVFSRDFIDYGSRVLLNTIEIQPHVQSVLDVGAGYGGIGLSLAINNPEIHFDLLDVNLKALELCKENAFLNHIENINAFESSCYENVNRTYDLIVTNPPIRAGKEIVHNILRNAYNHLNKNGELWVVIQKKQGAPSAKKCMEEVFDHVEVVKKDKGYYILKSIKTNK